MAFASALSAYMGGQAQQKSNNYYDALKQKETDTDRAERAAAAAESKREFEAQQDLTREGRHEQHGEWQQDFDLRKPLTEAQTRRLAPGGIQDQLDTLQIQTGGEQLKGIKLDNAFKPIMQNLERTAAIIKAQNDKGRTVSHDDATAREQAATQLRNQEELVRLQASLQAGLMSYQASLQAKMRAGGPEGIKDIYSQLGNVQRAAATEGQKLFGNDAIDKLGVVTRAGPLSGYTIGANSADPNVVAAAGAKTKKLRGLVMSTLSTINQSSSPLQTAIQELGAAAESTDPDVKNAALSSWNFVMQQANAAQLRLALGLKPSVIPVPKSSPRIPLPTGPGTIPGVFGQLQPQR